MSTAAATATLLFFTTARLNDADLSLTELSWSARAFLRLRALAPFALTQFPVQQ
jgi:hypothetical protein